MKIDEHVKETIDQIEGCNLLENVPMKDYTSFKIGGPADLLIEPTDFSSLQKVLQILYKHKIPYFTLGLGSNILVGDGGIRGVVLKLSALDWLEVHQNRIHAGAGVRLAKLATAALNANLTGLEFASGIPGSLGGAVMMNAGAYGGEMKNVISRVVALTPQGERKDVSNKDAKFGYRQSIFQENGWIVVEAEVQLQLGDPQKIRATMNDLNGRRKAKQPLEFPSAGSTFKRPPGYYAGALIEDAGLKGFRVGDAQVSEKHAGFVINRGNASAQQVLALIRQVQKKIKEQVGVDLETEVRCVGEFFDDSQ